MGNAAKTVQLKKQDAETDRKVSDAKLERLVDEVIETNESP